MPSVIESHPKPASVGASILGKLAEIDAHDLSPQMARLILDIRFDDIQQAHAAALAEKSQAGALTPDERADYTEYVHVADVLAIFKSKARQVLKKTAGKP